MYFDDVKMGMTVDIPPAVIEKEKMMDFARLYDNIPLHTDEEYAKKSPFGGLIAPGVMSFMSVWAKYLEVDLFDDDLLAGKSTNFRHFFNIFSVKNPFLILTFFAETTVFSISYIIIMKKTALSHLQ